MSAKQQIPEPARPRRPGELISYAGAVVRDLATEAGGGRAQARALERLRKSGDRRGGPVVIGPWISEVGFEVLYWIPALLRLVDRQRIPFENTTVISRGGAEPWYSEIAAGYVDILDHFTPAELKDFNARRVVEAGGQKHQDMTSFDEEILRRLGDKIDPDAKLIHPSAMYHAFMQYFRWKMPPRRLVKELRIQALPDPGPDPELARALPADYVAVKAYFSSCFPATDENRRFLISIIERLAAHTNVVLLSTGLDIDDHDEFVHAADGRVVDAQPLMTPRNNLTVQTRIIKGARALVTTYGGFSYLGPFLGVPSICFYSDHNFNPTHLGLAREMMRSLDDQQQFLSLDTRDLGLIDLLLGERERETA